jgi:hypothetical protein
MTNKIINSYSLISERIKYFTILGERHSSTNFLEYVLRSNLDIKSVWDFGHKHWIGNNRWKNISESRNTLFLGIVRNIYDWIGGMNRIPHHLSLLSNKSYESLISEPFISCDYNKFLEKMIYYDDRNYIKQTFYKNIFEARHYKNKFLYHYMPFLADNYVLLTFENFTKYHGEITSFISSEFKIASTRRYRISREYVDLSSKNKQYELPEHIHKEINDKTIWETEYIFGYEKRLIQESRLT